MSEGPSLAAVHPMPMQGAQPRHATAGGPPPAAALSSGAPPAGAPADVPGTPGAAQAVRCLLPPTSTQVVATVPTPSALDVVELLDQPVLTTFTFPATSVQVTCTAPPGAPEVTAVFGAVAFITGFTCAADGCIRLTVRVAFTVLGTDGNVRICQSDQIFEGSVGPGVDCTLAVPPATSVRGLVQAGPRTVQATLDVGSFQVTMGQRRSIRLLLAPSV